MKRYIKSFLFISCLFAILISLLFITRYYVAKHIDWSLSKEKHILFMGASHVCRGVDDSLTKEAINLGSPSERYLYTYIKLLHYVENNPQVDTVFCNVLQRIFGKILIINIMLTMNRVSLYLPIGLF